VPLVTRRVPLHWRSKLIHPRAHAPPGFRSLTTPTYRGSTVLFERQAEVTDDWRQTEIGYTYGLYGTPTVLELAARIAEIEGAAHTFIVPGGQAAIALIYLAFCKAGSHALVPMNAYGPNREMARGLLAGLGIRVETYDPRIGAGISRLIHDETALVWTESPASITMEIQDVPAVAAAARARGVPVALDNTYSAGVMFDAFAHGVDVSMQALTKYVGGHSDLLLGSVSIAPPASATAAGAASPSAAAATATATEATATATAAATATATADATLYRRIGSAYKQLGMAVSPDDCSLALRGLLTLGVRLERLESSTLAVAQWLARRPEIESVRHPALPSCPGHDLWRRDFTGSSSVFSVLFRPEFRAHVRAFADGLELFKVGFSWGGVTSLVMTYPELDRGGESLSGRVVRFNIGLEEPEDLIADLAASLEALKT
jgi:cystathionine beta-lyase